MNFCHHNIGMYTVRFDLSKLVFKERCAYRYMVKDTDHPQSKFSHLYYSLKFKIVSISLNFSHQIFGLCALKYHMYVEYFILEYFLISAGVLVKNFQSTCTFQMYLAQCLATWSNPKVRSHSQCIIYGLTI